MKKKLPVAMFLYAFSIVPFAYSEIVSTIDGRQINLKANNTYEVLGPSARVSDSESMLDAGGGFKYGKVNCKVSGAILECLTRVVGNRACNVATFTMDLLDADNSPIGQGVCMLSNAAPNRPVVLNCQSEGIKPPKTMTLHFANCI